MTLDEKATTRNSVHYVITGILADGCGGSSCQQNENGGSRYFRSSLEGRGQSRPMEESGKGAPKALKNLDGHLRGHDDIMFGTDWPLANFGLATFEWPLKEWCRKAIEKVSLRMRPNLPIESIKEVIRMTTLTDLPMTRVEAGTADQRRGSIRRKCLRQIGRGSLAENLAKLIHRLH